MKYIPLFFVFFVFLIQNIQANSLYVLKYNEYVRGLLSHHLSGMQLNSTQMNEGSFWEFLFHFLFLDAHFCAVILSPSEYTWQRTLEATFFNQKQNDSSHEKYRVDHCCRSLYKCNTQKHMELNATTDWHIQHCDCIHLFQMCLNNLNSSLSNEVAFIHSVNATKCYSKTHEIIGCIEYQIFSRSKNQLLNFMNSLEREKYLKRCIKYEFDENRPKKLHILDVPFIYHAVTLTNCMFCFVFMIFINRKTVSSFSYEIHVFIQKQW